MRGPISGVTMPGNRFLYLSYCHLSWEPGSSTKSLSAEWGASVASQFRSRRLISTETVNEDG